MLQGGISGIIGTLSGTILGVILALTVGDIVHGIELLTHTKLILARYTLLIICPRKLNLATSLLFSVFQFY